MTSVLLLSANWNNHFISASLFSFQHASGHRKSPGGFVCPICSKTFGLNHNLRRHMKTIHLGVKSHVCPVCSHRFGQSSDLKFHAKQMHGLTMWMSSNGKTNVILDWLDIHLIKKVLIKQICSFLSAICSAYNHARDRDGLDSICIITFSYWSAKINKDKNGNMMFQPMSLQKVWILYINLWCW